MRITGKELNLAEDVFKLQHLLDCKLLKVRDDMEELTSSAVKEEQIEGKLATVSLDWAEQNLVFSDYKTRGPMILKVSCHQLIGTILSACIFPSLLGYLTWFLFFKRGDCLHNGCNARMLQPAVSNHMATYISVPKQSQQASAIC